MVRVLIVEDDEVLADGIAQALRQNGYVVDHASTGPEALDFFTSHPYDTAILDLGLPDLDGLDVLKRVRECKNPVPVLILTARDTLNDRVKGLDLGADDYLAKPFKLQELEARIRALIRRKCFSNETELQLGSLRFDTNGRRVYLQDDPLELSAREMDVLELLLIHPGKVVSKAKFIDKLSSWDEGVTANAIEVYISRLRRKLEGSDIILRTMRGIGYILEAACED